MTTTPDTSARHTLTHDTDRFLRIRLVPYFIIHIHFPASYRARNGGPPRAHPLCIDIFPPPCFPFRFSSHIHRMPSPLPPRHRCPCFPSLLYCYLSSPPSIRPATSARLMCIHISFMYSSMYFLRCTHNAFSSGAPHLTVLTTTRVVTIHACSLWKGSRRLGQILRSLTSLARCSFGHTALQCSIERRLGESSI